MIRFFRYLLLVLAGLFGFAGHLSATTVYPLQLNAQIIPPYSNCLGDMVAGNVTSIRVTGLLRDLKAHSYNVGIGMHVYQGSQLKFATKTNHTEVVTNNTIHNFNLKDLFSPNNITGRYDGDGYCLKEGGYEFVFQAFDGGNARLPLSEPVRIHVYLSQAEPPRIIAPANGECVNYNAPVNFVWMEGAVTSYNPNRSYRLEIVELPEHSENLDAKSYINNNSTKITVEGIPGNLNFYTFQNTAGKLVKGRSYLWRVQLYDKTQMVSDARTVYSTSSAVANGGYSEVYTFKYTNCDPFGQRAEDQIDESKKPEIIRVDSSEALSTVVWKNDPENFPCGYIVCFNRADDTLSNWARVEVGPTDSTYTFKNVENGVQYLTHIIGIVDCQEDGTKTLSANSDNGSFTLPVPEEQECSTTIDGLTSQYSVENLKVNDYFTANDRNIKINKIERFIEGGDTTFSGEGQVLCPWFPTISLTTKFEKVKINRNYELVKGVVYVPTDSSNCGFFDLDEMMNDEYTGDGPAEEMSDKFKEYTSTDEIPEGELGVVNGELYAKVNGQAVDLGKVVPASDYEKKIQKGNIDAKLGIVDFEAVSYWNPPYDGDRENYSGDIDKYYTNYSTSSGNYTVPWFAMASGSTSDVKARLQINDNFPLDKLKFVCLTSSQAVELNAKKDQDFGSYTYYKLPIFGGEGETSLNLYAVATGNDGNPITLGRAQILSMPKYEQSVVLIPVKREASSIDQASIEKKLNEIYSPLGITYKVTVADKFDSEELDFMKDGLEVEGSGYLSTETDAMKQLKNLYAQSHTIEKDVAYIFVCPKAKYDGAEVKGDMPRSGQTGYVFSTAETYNDGWTVAHELGHGLYSLQHTFKKESAKGTTNNLMDYNDGSNLKVWQWNLLYSHKDFTTPFLESDEDGMYAAWKDVNEMGVILHSIPEKAKVMGLETVKKYIPFIDRSNSIILVPYDATELSFSNGYLISFCLKNGNDKLECWKSREPKHITFSGFYLNDNDPVTLEYKNVYFSHENYNQLTEEYDKVHYVRKGSCFASYYCISEYKRDLKGGYHVHSKDLPVIDHIVTMDNGELDWNGPSDDFMPIIDDEGAVKCLPEEYQQFYYYMTLNYDLNSDYKTGSCCYNNFKDTQLHTSDISVKQHLFEMLMYLSQEKQHELRVISESDKLKIKESEGLFIRQSDVKEFNFGEYFVGIWDEYFDKVDIFVVMTDKDYKIYVDGADNEPCSSDNWTHWLDKINSICKKETVSSLEDMINNQCCEAAIKNFPFEFQTKIINTLLSGGFFGVTDDYEKAILKIMDCIHKDNYLAFYDYLENDNALKEILDKFHDVGVWGNNNYTLFFQKLIQMYKEKPYPSNDLKGIFLSEHIDSDGFHIIENFDTDIDDRYYMNLHVNFQMFKEDYAEVNDGLGGIIYTKIRTNEFKSDKEWLYYDKVSPLTPIFVYETNDEVELSSQALNGCYVVPIVFLKYRNQKIWNNRAVTMAEIAGDLLTIYCSLGTATPYIATIKGMRKMAMLRAGISNAINLNKTISTTAQLKKFEDAYQKAKEIAAAYEKMEAMVIQSKEYSKAADVFEFIANSSSKADDIVYAKQLAEKYANSASSIEKIVSSESFIKAKNIAEEVIKAHSQEKMAEAIKYSEELVRIFDPAEEIAKAANAVGDVGKTFENYATTYTKVSTILKEIGVSESEISSWKVLAEKATTKATSFIEVSNDLNKSANLIKATNNLLMGSKLEEVRSLLRSTEYAKLATIEGFNNFSAFAQGLNASMDLLRKFNSYVNAVPLDCEILSEFLDNVSIAVDILSVIDGCSTVYHQYGYRKLGSDWVDNIDEITLKKKDFKLEASSTLISTWHTLYKDFDNVVNIGNTSKEDYEKLKERVGAIEKELNNIYEKAK